MEAPQRGIGGGVTGEVLIAEFSALSAPLQRDYHVARALAGTSRAPRAG